jgi:2-keto-4-pentenoate hydratase/2-oxohepta-3-ene-1,7-dioic acid hydratase in catechol pathway
VLLYRTNRGLARGEDDALVLLDVPHRDLLSLLADGPALSGCRLGPRVGLDAAELFSPVDAPGRLIVVGANYRGHVAEAGMPTPENPLFLLVPDSGLVGPRADIVLPALAPKEVDFEGELAVVIGAAGSRIPADRAWRHIAGLTIVNDVTARDVQASGLRDGRLVDAGTVARSKSFPTFKPLGPSLLVGDDIADRDDLLLQTFVNGELRQHARTTEMLFALPEIIEYVSSSLDLTVGDVILTGTPAGVGLPTGTYLSPGDVVEVRVEEIGWLRNTVAAAGR